MLQSRREFLIGAVVSTAFPGNRVALSADMALLASLTADELELVQNAMANHPTVTLAETIDMLKAFGM